MNKIFLIGGGGHCKSCIDVIENTGEFHIEGIFDVKEKVGDTILGYKIIGTDDDIKDYIKNENVFLITVGQIKSPALRIKLYKLNLNFVSIISPRAYVSKHASIGSGTIIMHDSIINAGASIGNNCIINTKALIEHDTIVEDHCHISTNAILNGDCHIGKGSFVGSNTVLREGTSLQENSILSFGTKK